MKYERKTVSYFSPNERRYVIQNTIEMYFNYAYKHMFAARNVIAFL